ncbi:MAG: hypothetical protein KIS83_03615 [Rubrivivax sp.]|nr:hypothetical protein [Rubrivivax sp.]
MARPPCTRRTLHRWVVGAAALLVQGVQGVQGAQGPQAVADQAVAGPDAAAVQAGFAGRWVAPYEPLALRLDADTAAAASALRFFVGAGDVSALVRRPAPDRIEIAPLAGGWAPGETELVVWRVADGQWSELARWPLRVRTAAGFETSEWQPQLELQAGSRTGERLAGGAPATPRAGRADGTGRAALGWTGTRDGWQLQAQANVAGASQRAQALRFAQLQDRAPKVDLADYRLAAGHGGHLLEIGHLSHGSHPLLAQAIASRGLGARLQLAPALDLTVAALNGRQVAGGDDLLGLEDRRQRSLVLTLGAELLPARPGALRAELSWLDASQVAEAGFDTGEVPDAERSRGLGLRLLGSGFDGRVRGELAWARSRFVNPFDPLLALGGELQPVRAATQDAHQAELQLELLRQAAVFGTARPLDLALTLRHERAAPLYRSLGAFVTADQELARVQLQAALAGAQLQLHAVQRHDNLARIATLLRNRTDEQGATLALPLPAWFGAAGNTGATPEGAEAGAPSPWWPAASLSWQRVHQHALNEPEPEASGIAATHRPDQVNRNVQLNLQWTLPQGWAFGYALARSHQDNRQPGRETADFRNLSHQVSLTAPITDTLRATLALTRSRNLSVETALVAWTTGGTLGVDWQASERWALAVNLSNNRSQDSLDNASARSLGVQLQSSWRFELPGPGRPLPVQAFVRVSRQGERSLDRVFDQRIDQRIDGVDVGLSMSFF